MLIQKPEQSSREKLPTAPAGTHRMKCFFEAPNKFNPDQHSLLFKNDKYQFRYNVWHSHLYQIAKHLKLQTNDSEALDTRVFRNIEVNLTLEEQVYNARTYMKCIRIESADPFHEVKTLEDSMDDLPVMEWTRVVPKNLRIPVRKPPERIMKFNQKREPT